MSEVVGRVIALNRYPVKSMQGQQPTAATFDATGMLGDRRWAVRAIDDAAGLVLSAKRERALLEATASGDGTDGSRPTITLPDGQVVEAGDPDTDQVLSRWLGRAVTLVEVGGPGGGSIELSFDVDDEDQGVFSLPLPADRFVDACPIHLLTTASIATVAAEHPGGAWDPHRFRPGVLIETDPAVGGHPEHAWLDATVTIGTVVVRPLMPTLRCVMTTRAQPAHGLGRDLAIVKTINAANGGNLGLYGSIEVPGTVAVGDPVSIA